MNGVFCVEQFVLCHINIIIAPFGLCCARGLFVVSGIYLFCQTFFCYEGCICMFAMPGVFGPSGVWLCWEFFVLSGEGLCKAFICCVGRF